MSIRVVIADDSLLIREAVANLVSDEADLEVVASVTDADTLVAAVLELGPDAVVTDVRMPPDHRDEGIWAAARIRTLRPETGVVVLSQHLRREYATRLFSGGVAGRAYLLKDRIAERGQLATAIREVAAGGSVIDPLVVEELLSPGDSRLARLTPREIDVLREMARGANNRGIAEALVLTERAVAKHINSLFAKLDLHEEDSVHRRVQAVLVYLGLS
ncbi:MAG TPA: response regulator transcription factor [Actinomycetales bacterium]|nr:response regulator transcription factor [Actinomycetales bacterium]